MFNLWLDDVRDPLNLDIRKSHLYLLKGVWVWARTNDEAIELLKTGHVNTASFDHDLGMAGFVNGGTTEIDYDNNARKTINFLIESWNIDNATDGHKKYWPKQKPYVHSANPDGAKWIRGMIDRYGPYSIT